MLLEIVALVRALSLCCVLAVAYPEGAKTIKEAPKTADIEADAAIKHFRLAVEFYRLGNFDAARVEVEAAYGQPKVSDLLHNLSLTPEKQGQIGEAIDFEERSSSWRASAAS